MRVAAGVAVASAAAGGALAPSVGSGVPPPVAAGVALSMTGGASADPATAEAGACASCEICSSGRYIVELTCRTCVPGGKWLRHPNMFVVV